MVVAGRLLIALHVTVPAFVAHVALLITVTPVSVPVAVSHVPSGRKTQLHVVREFAGWNTKSTNISNGKYLQE